MRLTGIFIEMLCPLFYASYGCYVPFHYTSTRKLYMRLITTNLPSHLGPLQSPCPPRLAVQSTLKALTRCSKHPLAHWSEYSRTSKLGELFNIPETLFDHCRYKDVKAFLSLIESEILEAGLANGSHGKYFWKVSNLRL